MPPITDAEKAAVLARLRNEALVPLDDPALLAEAEATYEKLVRWITRGKLGVRLDGRREAGAWYTSREAVERFRAAVKEAEG